MTPRMFLLAGSFALNGLCLVGFALVPASVPPPVRDFLGRHFPSLVERPAPAPKPAKSKPVVRKALWPSLDTGGDLKALASRLRAAGFPADIIRSMLLAELSARYDRKMSAIWETDASTPFWKSAPIMMGYADTRMEEYGRLQRERTKLQRELFSDPFFASDDITAEQRRKFGNLSREKVDALQRIEDDYAEMIAAINSATKGILLPEDREKLELLQRERRADLAGVLTREELADYEIRSSEIASTLVRQLANFNATEAEFRAIFQAQMALSEKLGPNGFSSPNFEDRQAAIRQLNDQLKASLGAARYADYARETDRNYQQLVRLLQRENLPPDTAVRAFNVRDSVAVESGRIVDNPALTVDQKRAALEQLAAGTRTQLLGMLGPTAGPTYVQLIDRQWLNVVARGSAVTFDGTGSMMGFSSGSSSGLPAFIAFGTGPNFRNASQPPPPPQPPTPPPAK